MIIRIGVAVLLLLPTAAFAQGNPGPFGGLFGRTPERIGKQYRLFEARTVVTGQYEDAVNERSVPSEQRLPSRGIGSAGITGLFEQRSTRVNFALRSRAMYQQYLDAPYTGGTTVDSSALVTYKVASRLVLDGALSHLYTPYFQFFPQFFSWTEEGLVVPPSSPYVATAVENQAYAVTGSVTSAYAKHSAVGASFERREMRFADRPEFNASIYGVRGRWTRQLHRDLQIRLGYGRDRVRLHAGDERTHEIIDAGVGFSRPLSARQRTALAVNTELAKLWTPEFGRHYRFNGGLTLTRWYGRTWLVGVQAQRSTDFVAGFLEPLLFDTGGVQISGMLSRRNELAVQIHGGRGQSGFESGAERFTMATATAQFSQALTRRIGLFVQHAFFYYELPQVASPVAPVTYLNRQTITFGMTTWIPIYNRERSPSDTR